MPFHTTVALLLFALAGCASPRYATEAILNRHEPFDGMTLRQGRMAVEVAYQAYDLDDGPSENLQYEIRLWGAESCQGAQEAYAGMVSLKQLDGDALPEVVVESYSGGAHCCTTFYVYDWRDGAWQVTENGMWDSWGLMFKDLDGDGEEELLTGDNSFLYTFSSYAHSFPPTRVLSFQEGTFVDVTRNYPDVLRDHLRRMRGAIYEQLQDAAPELNGILAGSVAQSALLGEEEAGWAFLRDIYALYATRKDDVITRFGRTRTPDYDPTFPATLRDFLTEAGYVGEGAE